jgi:hypothetical protein
LTARPDIGATRPPTGDGSTPYGRPIVKEPVWKWEIPLYLYTGGLAGASAGLALLTDASGHHQLARRAWCTALAGSIASPALLISDLGVPRRFLNMLRLLKVTSPMSVGSWILAAFGPATAAATAHALTAGGLGGVGRAAQGASAALGMPLASYTAALLASTSVPAWHEARRDLPFVFVAGAAMSAGAAATTLSPAGVAGPARRLAVGAAAAELALTELMEHRLRRVGLDASIREGTPGRLMRIAKVTTAAGAAVVAWRGARSRAAAVAGGALLTAGALTERWGIFEAGRRSAARPQDTAQTQRAAIVRGDARGSARQHPVAAGSGEGDWPGSATGRRHAG